MGCFTWDWKISIWKVLDLDAGVVAIDFVIITAFWDAFFKGGST
jgi:hypothetical protein